MGMHKTSLKKKNPSPAAWSKLAFDYNVKVFNLLKDGGEDDFNDLINREDVWVVPTDITIHSMEKMGKLYAVVFYRSSSEAKVSAADAKKTPRELLEEDIDEAKSVDEE